MKRTFLAALLIGIAAQMATKAQTQPASQQKTLAATMNVYVFPSQGQAATQQSKDEAECYTWAVQNTGTDPFQLAKQAQAAQQQQAQTAQATQGAAVKGAARGAAGGALIGGIAGDAGKGAAIGAATGAVVGRHRRNQAEAQAEQQSQSVQAATAEQMTNFKKAFSVCLEAKKYMVKY
ncbi:MAG TPA: glycine zipper family protein [Thermoanaerobaculia bacterium]|nr:glycine zipper family protein [Thermoanaerobaculia bacterium]